MSTLTQLGKMKKQDLIKLATEKGLNFDEKATNKQLVKLIHDNRDTDVIEVEIIDGKQKFEIPKGSYGIFKNGKFQYTVAYHENTTTLTSVMRMLKVYIDAMREHKGLVFEIQFSNGQKYDVTKIKSRLTSGLVSQVESIFGAFRNTDTEMANKIVSLMASHCELNLLEALKIASDVSSIEKRVNAVNTDKLKAYVSQFKGLGIAPKDLNKDVFLEHIGGANQLSIVNQSK